MIGKFENEEALLKSYGDLEREFTKKCQELSKLKKEFAELDTKGSDEIVVDNEEKVSAEEAVDEIEPRATNVEVVDEEISHDLILNNAIKNDVDEDADEKKEPLEKRELDESFNNLLVRAKANEFLLNNIEARAYSREIAKVLMKDKSLLSCSDPFQVAYALVLKDKQSRGTSTSHEPALNGVVEVKEESVDSTKIGGVSLLGRNHSVFSPARIVKKYRNIDDARDELIRRFS